MGAAATEAAVAAGARSAGTCKTTLTIYGEAKQGYHKTMFSIWQTGLPTVKRTMNLSEEASNSRVQMHLTVLYLKSP